MAGRKANADVEKNTTQKMDELDHVSGFVLRFYSQSKQQGATFRQDARDVQSSRLGLRHVHVHVRQVPPLV